MADFLKIQTDVEYVFQPVTEDFDEKFAVWDIPNKKFIREGEVITDTAAGKQDVNKYIKLTDEEKKKKYNRSLKFNILSIVDGEEKLISFPPGAKAELEKEFETLKALKKEPTSFEYKFKRAKKGGTGFLNYTFSIVRELGVEEEPEDVGEIDIGVKKSDGLTLTPTEEKIVNALKNKPEAKDFNTEERLSVFVDNYGITAERAHAIISKHF